MGTRTALFSRNTPGGVFDISSLEQHPGDVWFVCSVTGTDGTGYGENPDAPFATIDYAMASCTDSKGDVIYVLPGHNETLVSATACVFDKIGVSVIGLGRGSNRPTLDFDDTDGIVAISAADCRLSNVILNADTASTVLGVDVNAHNFELDHCYFTFTTTGDEFITCVSVSAFDRCHIHDNIFETEEAAGAAAAGIELIDTNDTIIERNLFRGFWSGGAILGKTTLSARLMILNNVIYNSNTAVYSGLDLGALNNTGIVAGNMITSLYPSPLTKSIRAGGATWHHNSMANTVSERGAMTIPTTSSV